LDGEDGPLYICLKGDHPRTIPISRVMVFNATFNNISVISWQSVLLVEETGVPRENHRPDYQLERMDMDVNEHERLSNFTL